METLSDATDHTSHQHFSTFWLQRNPT